MAESAGPAGAAVDVHSAVIAITTLDLSSLNPISTSRALTQTPSPCAGTDTPLLCVAVWLSIGAGDYPVYRGSREGKPPGRQDTTDSAPAQSILRSLLIAAPQYQPFIWASAAMSSRHASNGEPSTATTRIDSPSMFPE